MTVREALNQRIRFIQLPEWKLSDGHIELPLLDNGMCGPWATVRDRSGIEQKLLITTLLKDQDDRYEAYKAAE